MAQPPAVLVGWVKTKEEKINKTGRTFKLSYAYCKSEAYTTWVRYGVSGQCAAFARWGTWFRLY